MKKRNKTIKLDREEQKILGDFERGEYISVGDIDKRRKEISQAAKNTLAKNKRINIRMREEDLLLIKRKAEEHGLPYQTLINTILRHYAKGKIEISL